ncbi:hydrophobin [Aspergillus udagawae]|uniref:Hydrophobin n=1 Tax=Aspergillus udagawae TaxID=91492 RepID=A0ABQ1B6K6_9EURO|nr:hydrophobin [Aspergillus udagawae]GFF94694.1 hydrophobin [Aspergillus udagawae]GFG25385.1 hydrophobin [Aspergillus udagawae]
MQFTTGIAALLLAVSAAAMEAGGEKEKGWGGHYPPIPSDMTIKEATRKCGDQAQLSCCNKAIRSGDVTDIGGALKNVIGGGSGNSGLEIFDQCSKLDVQIAILAIPIEDILDKQCKQNVACCMENPASADGDLIGVGLACIALGNLL